MYAVNWNRKETIFNALWKQNVAQMWTDTEFKVARDIPSWLKLTEDEQEAYNKVLAGLTGLDTLQGDGGMPLIQLDTDEPRKAAVFSFMGMMEHMHAKSYSTIFTTLISPQETDYLLDEFVHEQPQLLRKSDTITKAYAAILPQRLSVEPIPYSERTQEELIASYNARVASVFLESFLFYSGFYYPLFLKGQGKMVSAGEIIRKILLDESIHGVAVGFDAQDIYVHLTEDNKKLVDRTTIDFLNELYDNEKEYTKTIYGKLGQERVDDVLNFVMYNGNKALANLGKPPHFKHDPFNPIVMNALATDTGTHDFFSVKGDGYEMARNVTPLSDKDFDFSDIEEDE